MGMYWEQGKTTALTPGKAEDPPQGHKEGAFMSAGRREQKYFTFRIGARKTEIPVSTKTMMPVTLCSLEWGQEQDQPVLGSPPQGTTEP